MCMEKLGKKTNMYGNNANPAQFIHAVKMGFKLVAQIQQVSSDWVAVHWSDTRCDMKQILDLSMLFLLTV